MIRRQKAAGSFQFDGVTVMMALMRKVAFMGYAARAIVFVTLLVLVMGQRAEARGPESLSGLAEKVMDAVVNISAATTAPADTQHGVPMPQFPPGSPFQEFFDEFWVRMVRMAAMAERFRSANPRHLVQVL